jgi:sugar phosphate permease
VTSRPKFFYGWWIVLGAALSYGAVIGFLYYTFGVFAVPLQEKFGWDRAQIYLVQTMWAVVMACLAFGVGWFIDRFGPRLLMACGGVLVGLGMVGLSRMSSLRDFYLFNFVAAIGASACSLIPAQTVVAKWFVKRRGLAMGITLAGGGVAGFIAPQVAGHLIRASGIRGGYLGLAIICWALIVPASLLLMRRQPADMGLFPDGVEPEEVPETGQRNCRSEATGLDMSQAVSTLSFWILLLMYLMLNFAYNAVHPHLIPMLTDEGVAATIAERGFGLTVGISAFFRFAGGALADRVNKKLMAATCSVFFALAIIALLINKSAGVLFFVVPLWGVALGCSAPVMPLLVADTMGTRSFGKIISFMMICQVAGAALGPAFSGFVHKYLHNYQPALVTAAALYVTVAVLVFLLRSFTENAVEQPQGTSSQTSD